MAVTKTVGVDEVQALLGMGQNDFGENRIQPALQKIAGLSDLRIRWHMIGRVQTNKASKVAGRFELVHSLDSLHLAEALDRAARKNGVTVDALAEVNVSGEGAKAGFPPGELPAALARMAECRSIRVRGLMTMAPLTSDPETTRPVFRRLRELRDELRAAPGGSLLRHLSMGMTQDFEVAVEEGADIVRIGTALFVP